MRSIFTISKAGANKINNIRSWLVKRRWKLNVNENGENGSCDEFAAVDNHIKI